MAFNSINALIGLASGLDAYNRAQRQQAEDAQREQERQQAEAERKLKKQQTEQEAQAQSNADLQRAAEYWRNYSDKRMKQQPRSGFEGYP